MKVGDFQAISTCDFRLSQRYDRPVELSALTSIRICGLAWSRIIGYEIGFIIYVPSAPSVCMYVLVGLMSAI